MKLDEWRKARSDGEPFTLPSGLDVRLRKVTALDLVLQGTLPTTLYAKADAYINERGGIDAEKFVEFEPVINALCVACVVDPKVGLNGEGDLAVTEIPIEDRLEIFSWANQASGALQKFRPEQSATVDAAQPGA
jgi:hypothetical protein